MNDSINLAKAESSGDLRKRKKILILRTISFIFVGFVGIVSIILFILYARISVSSVKREQAKVTQSIALQKDKLAKFNLLNDRLRGINKILMERKNYTNILNSLLGLIPTGASPSVLNINKDGISITITSSSLLPLNKFIDNTVDLTSKKSLIREMVIESLVIDSKTGIYSLSIKAKII